MRWDVAAEAFPQLLAAVPMTLYLVIASLLVGAILAMGVATARVSKNPIIWRLAYGYVYVFRGTPLLVQIFLIYYGSGQFRPLLQDIGLWIFFREATFCAILALTLNTAAYTSEIIRGGIQSVAVGQIEAGRAVGMSQLQVFFRITLPQAIRQAIPAYGNEIILMVKASSLASTITILDITGVAKKIQAATFAPVETFLMAGVLYLTINFLAVQGIRWLEAHLSHGQRTKRRGSYFANLKPR